MGVRGPIPKPAEARRRTNAPAIPVKKAARGAAKPKAKKAAATEEAVPEKWAPSAADPSWHAIARNWYDSLALSGQSEFYEPSDWNTAFLLADSISRDLNPQFVGFTEKGDVIMEPIPLKGSSLAAYLKGMGNLLVTEGDRRRMSVDLVRGKQVDPDAERALALVTQLHSRRSA